MALGDAHHRYALTDYRLRTEIRASAGGSDLRLRTRISRNWPNRSVDQCGGDSLGNRLKRMANRLEHRDRLGDQPTQFVKCPRCTMRAGLREPDTGGAPKCRDSARTPTQARIARRNKARRQCRSISRRRDTGVDPAVSDIVNACVDNPPRTGYGRTVMTTRQTMRNVPTMSAAAPRMPPTRNRNIRNQLPDPPPMPGGTPRSTGLNPE